MSEETIVDQTTESFTIEHLPMFGQEHNVLVSLYKQPAFVMLEPLTFTRATVVHPRRRQARSAASESGGSPD